MKLKMLLILTVLIIYTSSAFAVPTKKYDDITKTLKVIDNGKDVLVIKQQSIVNEITTFEEVFNITAVDNYKFKDKDLTVRWEKFKGIEDILGAELFIKQRISYQVNVPIIGHDLINIPENKKFGVPKVPKILRVIFIFNFPTLSTASNLSTPNFSSL